MICRAWHDTYGDGRSSENLIQPSTTSGSPEPLLDELFIGVCVSISIRSAGGSSCTDEGQPSSPA